MNLEASSLPPLLALAVPLLIAEMARRGGPADEDYARVASYTNDLAYHGDDLLYASRKPGETSCRFQQVAEAIAVLSFCPGGIAVFGLHFDGAAVQDPVAREEAEDVITPAHPQQATLW